MTRYELKNQTKQELKEVAINIRTLKNERKDRKDGTKVRALWETEDHLDTLRRAYRHKHIAYCMFFNNTPYEEIERTCDEGPCWGAVDGHKSNWEEEIEEHEEDVRLSA